MGMGRDERSEPSTRREWRERIGAWGQTWHEMRTTWERPRARRVARTGALALRALSWRERIRSSVAASRASLARMRTTFRLAYFVVPAVAPVRSIRRGAAPALPPVAPRVRIIVNPTSGSVRGVWGPRDLEEVAAWLSERGLPAEVCRTEYAGHATRLAQEAVRAGMEMVVAAGGDGTVNDVIQALAGRTTALGVLPLGTVNVWAREMGIPLGLAQAREVLLSGVRRRVDLGRAGSRYFLLMAGIGFDAEVARRVETSWLKRAGLKLLDYAATVGLLGMTHQPARVWLRYDGKRRGTSALMILIGNTRLYAGALTFAKRAVADDGLLDVVIVGGGGLIARMGVLARALLRRASLGPRVRYAQCRVIRIESNQPLPVQVDGEVIGTLPMTFSVAPGGLRVVVPADAPDALFRHDPLPADGWRDA
jgi:diacylglycerol kinase (ATP)